MLAQRFRLRRAADLRQVRLTGRSWRHPLVVLLAEANNEDVSRFAFVAGRRVGNAPTRNRCKRLLREAVRQHLSEVEVGWDCMFIARNPIASASYKDVETAVSQLLIRAKLMLLDS